MHFLSIDIGIKNLGFAIYYQNSSEAIAFDFGLYNINDDIKDHTHPPSASDKNVLICSSSHPLDKRKSNCTKLLY